MTIAIGLRNWRMTKSAMPDVHAVPQSPTSLYSAQCARSRLTPFCLPSSGLPIVCFKQITGGTFFLLFLFLLPVGDKKISGPVNSAKRENQCASRQSVGSLPPKLA